MKRENYRHNKGEKMNKTHTVVLSLALSGIAAFVGGGCASTQPNLGKDNLDDRAQSEMRVMTDEEMAQVRGCPTNSAYHARDPRKEMLMRSVRSALNSQAYYAK